MSTNENAPHSEVTILHRAITAFAPFLERDALLMDATSPNAHPMNQSVDAHSGKITGSDGKTLFLKALSQDQKPWLGFKSASEMAQRTGDAGFSPNLIGSDEATNAFLFECLDDNWQPATVLDLRAEEVREAILAATKKLHALAPLEHSISFDEQIAALRQQMEAGVRHVTTGATIKVTPPENYTQICAVIDQIDRGFSAAAHDIAPCHVENSLSNFMLGTKGDVKLVDFDRAANCDPLSDVGALCNEFCRTDSDIAQAVEIYSGGTKPARVARVKLHMIRSAFFWGMWGKVSHFSSCRPGIEYYKYGENQFMRCLYHIASWDVDQLIREM